MNVVLCVRLYFTNADGEDDPHHGQNLKMVLWIIHFWVFSLHMTWGVLLGFCASRIILQQDKGVSMITDPP